MPNLRGVSRMAARWVTEFRHADREPHGRLHESAHPRSRTAHVWVEPLESTWRLDVGARRGPMARGVEGSIGTFVGVT